MTDRKITPLPTKFRKPPPRDALTLVSRPFDSNDCTHDEGFIIGDAYIDHDAEATVSCRVCSAKLDPMWVLRRYKAEVEDLHNRRAMKCTRCGQQNRVGWRRR